jgi:hypothetical protein
MDSQASALQVLPDLQPKELYACVPAFTPGSVFHGFFGRAGGVSKGVYHALNCGPGSDDAIESVKENLAIVAEAPGLKAEQIVTLHQVHGDTCVRVEKPWPLLDRPQADAAVTDKPGIGLGILTADCAPVLFFAEKADGSPVIGAAHAGWKGAVGGVLESVVKAMQAYGLKPGSLRAAIGPCIGQASYEVGPDFPAPFLDENPENEKFFRPARKHGHFQFDLPGYCAAKLASIGVSQVAIKDLDTYFNEEDFFSYRRTTHRGDKDYGRQISLIAIAS